MRNRLLRKMYEYRVTHFLCLILFLVACDKKEKGTQNDDIAEKKEVIVDVPVFNADSAYSYLQKQVDFGPRVPNTASHGRCAGYLVKKLESLGASVEKQDFEANAYDGKKLYLTNIIASYYPERKKRVLLAAHWDTRPFADKDSVNVDKPIAGANDGASGVAVLLEIARQIQANPNFKIGIDIIFFDGEDYGIPEGYKGTIIPELRPPASSYCLGSQYWSKNKHKPHYSAFYGILLDMVGARGAKFYYDTFSNKTAPSIVKKVWNHASKEGYSDFFINQQSGDITDDHVFVSLLGKIPMIDIVEYDPSSKNYFGFYHHTHQDNMDIIDKSTLTAVGQTVLRTVYYEDQ
ncbi:M28 family peptidase [Fulvivirgaceae bacterium BMA10]|uniref:M28 family peptidase n=1 Tax=Splendidivirga corallicola TaxID=3051826 RepID=A0ABT8KLI0_9BACT|nr:M28 family peptidase [Fulvivirgaceae bacterium BMA10]